MAKPGQPETIGRYTLYGEIAAGRLGNVYFGRRRGSAGLSRTLAVKRMHPNLASEAEFVSAMMAEARLAARIQHANVVPTLVAVADGKLLLVMEYVRGESLARLLELASAAATRVPLPILSAIAGGALAGLHAAHEARSESGGPLGLVHTDLSPQHILVGTDGVARVIDFIVTKAAAHLERVVEGRMAYKAPEQIAAREVTRTADVYAMAAVLWEALTGKALFAGDDDDVFCQVLEGVKAPPSRHAPGVPAELDALVMKGLAPRPADRFASAREMAEALARVVPPASAAEVSEWVEQLARWRLAQRDAAFAEADKGGGEASTTLYPPSDPALAAVKDAPGEEEEKEEEEYASVSEGEFTAIPPEGATFQDDEAPAAPASASSGSVEVPRRRPASAARPHNVRRLTVLRALRTKEEAQKLAEQKRRGRMLAVVATAAGLIAVASVTALLWRGGALGGHAEPSAMTPPPAPTPVAVAPVAPPVSNVASAAPSPAPSSAPPVFTVAAPPPPPVASVASLPAPPTRPTRTTAAAPPPPTPAPPPATSPPKKRAAADLQSSGF
jgi:eukaryotic-like serine/threonine-protein kinase